MVKVDLMVVGNSKGSILALRLGGCFYWWVREGGLRCRASVEESIGVVVGRCGIFGGSSTTQARQSASGRRIEPMVGQQGIRHSGPTEDGAGVRVAGDVPGLHEEIGADLDHGVLAIAKRNLRFPGFWGFLVVSCPDVRTRRG